MLAGTAIVVAGSGELGDAVRERAAALGAVVAERAVDPAGDEPAFEGAADVLVYDGSAVPGIQAVLDGAWLTIRPVATAAMIEHGGGLIVLLAPRPGGAAERGRARRPREPRAHPERRVGAVRGAAGGDPARSGDEPRRGGGARGVPGLAGGRVLLGLRVHAGDRPNGQLTGLLSAEKVSAFAARGRRPTMGA